MAEAMHDLRLVAKDPNCTMVDLVKNGKLMELSYSFNELKFACDANSVIMPDSCF